LVNATWTSAGKFGNALSFNGSNARVDVADAASLHLTSGLTLEAWVNPAAVSSAWRDVIYKGNDNYYLEGTSSNAGNPAGGGTFGGANANAYGASSLPVGSWSYLALTYEGSALRLYVNGSLMSTQAAAGAIATSSNALQIGGDSIWGQYFNGLIDEVRIYNLALTAAQIQTDMTTAVGGGGGGGDTQPPTAPGTLTATAAGSSQINLSWGAATDNVGVTGYRIERCQGAGCTNFAQIATTTGTSFSDTGLTASTSYSYQVRAADAAGNLGPYSNVASATTQAGTTTPGLVAAYGFEEGSGTTTADASGNGNTGTLVNATWTTAGKYGKALSFNGTNARVDIPDAASLHLSSGMTLEAWVNPTVVNNAWRDVIYKGNDNFYLMGTTTPSGMPAGGGTFGGTNVNLMATSTLPVNTWTHLTATYDGAMLRFYVNGAPVASVAQTGAQGRGGNQGGGARLTPHGQQLAALFKELQERLRTTATGALPGLLAQVEPSVAVHVAAAISLDEVLGRLLAGPDGTPAPVDAREHATAATSVLAAVMGAWGVRVHEVAPSRDALKVVSAWSKAAGQPAADADPAGPPVPRPRGWKHG
jgi:chitodextrinase